MLFQCSFQQIVDFQPDWSTLHREPWIGPGDRLVHLIGHVWNLQPCKLPPRQPARGCPMWGSPQAIADAEWDASCSCPSSFRLIEGGGMNETDDFFFPATYSQSPSLRILSHLSLILRGSIPLLLRYNSSQVSCPRLMHLPNMPIMKASAPQSAD